MAFVLLVVLAAPFAVLYWASHDGEGRVPEGTVISGVDIGGLDRDTAIERLQAQVAEPLDRAVKVEVSDGTRKHIGADGAGVSLGIEDAVDEAVAFGARGNFILRGWRELTGSEVASNARIDVDVDKAKVERFVNRLSDEVAVAPKEPELAITLESVSFTDGSPGRRLADPEGLTEKIVRTFRDADTSHELTVPTEKVKPIKKGDDLWAANPTVVTVSRDSTTVRVFDRGELTTTYSVAVGQPAYPTPTGTFTVQSKQVDPIWTVPDSDWAGSMAGQVIPGGDPSNPLVARWIGFNGSVGFHGTADTGSIGSFASHGCVRMNPSDVIDLYDRVEVGTTVYVA